MKKARERTISGTISTYGTSKEENAIVAGEKENAKNEKKKRHPPEIIKE